MLEQFSILTRSHLRGILRDRMLYGIFGVAVVMILLVPSLSSFSMRQVQELAITLSLSVVSATMLVVTLLLGASSVWRDIERRYTSSILTLPISRSTFILGKFASIVLFLALTGLVLGIGVAVVIALTSASYPSDIPIHWGNIALAVTGDLCKYMLLTALALTLSSLSTSFYLPFFGTLAIFLCGSASQEVYEYVAGEFGREMNPIAVVAVKGAYYLLPNFSAFDFQVHAVYGLTIPLAGLSLSLLYALVYTGILLFLSVMNFERRELP